MGDGCVPVWPPVTQRDLSKARPDLGSGPLICRHKTQAQDGGVSPRSWALHRDRCCLPSSLALQERTEHKKTEEMNCFWARTPSTHSPTPNNEKQCSQLCSQIFLWHSPLSACMEMPQETQLWGVSILRTSQMQDRAICNASLSGFLKNEILVGYIHYISGGLLPQTS